MRLQLYGNSTIMTMTGKAFIDYWIRDSKSYA